MNIEPFPANVSEYEQTLPVTTPQDAIEIWQDVPTDDLGEHTVRTCFVFEFERGESGDRYTPPTDDKMAFFGAYDISGFELEVPLESIRFARDEACRLVRLTD